MPHKGTDPTSVPCPTFWCDTVATDVSGPTLQLVILGSKCSLTAGLVPDMIRSCSKALLSTQRQAPGIHQVPKELPACWHLETLLALGLGNSAQQTSLLLLSLFFAFM